MDFLSPSNEAQKEAKNHPNGYVYVIEDKYKGKENIPPEAIIGAWKVDKNGLIIGKFIKNPSYPSSLP